MDAPAEGLRAAIASHRAGDHAAAERGYREHLSREPEDPSGLHFLGLLRSHQGKHREAIVLMLKALERNPYYVDAWSNLAIAFYEEHDLARAEKCCRRALELSPEFVNAWANLGMTLNALERFDEALAAWGEALARAPAIMRSVAIPYGQLLYKLDRIPEALEFYRRWRAASPDDPIPQHMLAASGGSELPARASDAYVRATFDDFADSFDQSLERLKYRAPELLVGALRASDLLPRESGLEILDIGCGTGLCGPLLRPLARRLVGVDLSPKMLAKAAARGVYEQLNCGELSEWLAGCGQTFDAAVAADVLCYFGDLSSVFARIRAVLAPGGCFACSLETAPESAAQATYVLRPHGRYQHRRSYVAAMLAAAGFERIGFSEEILRYERREAVTGMVVTARAAA
jgi:predicted TPR repeat methyltransferase